MKERTLSQIIENFAAHGQETAYIQRCGYRSERWTYRNILDTSRQFARELSARGIQTGDHVCIWGENCAEWVVAFFGSVLHGAVVVPVDYTASTEYVSRVCRQVESRLIVRSHNLPAVCPDIPTIFLGNLAGTVACRSRDLYGPKHVRAQDPVEIVFTSGTTAEPKGVVLSHENILANLEPIEREIHKYLKYERIVHPLRFMNVLPLSHVF